MSTRHRRSLVETMHPFDGEYQYSVVHLPNLLSGDSRFVGLACREMVMSY